MENRLICKCKNVTLFDVEDALRDSDCFECVQKSFEDVQKATQCSTGCGGCHDEIIEAISEILMGDTSGKR